MSDPTQPMTPAEIEAAIEAAVAERLKDIKAKLNTVYSERDTALEKLKTATAAIDAAKVEALKREGKENEALKLELDAAKAKALEAEERATKLSRDAVIRGALASVDFTSNRAREIAFSQLLPSFVQDSKGVWTHASGKSVETAVEEFIKDDDNAFLLKVKASSGGGSSSSKRQAPPATKPLSQLSNQELIERTRNKRT